MPPCEDVLIPTDGAISKPTFTLSCMQDNHQQALTISRAWQQYMWGTDVMKIIRESWDKLVEEVERGHRGDTGLGYRRGDSKL